MNNRTDRQWPNWYVIHCFTGKEDEVRSKVKGTDIIKAIVPRRMMKERRKGVWRMIERVIFPGYVFVEAEMTPQAYYDIRCIPGVMRILGGTGRPQPLPEDEVSLLIKLAQDGEPLGLSEVFVEGEKVTVISGPLKGLEGKIVKLDARRFRAKVNISIIGQPRIVELAANVIEKS